MLQGWESMYYGVGSFSADSNILVQLQMSELRKDWRGDVKALPTVLHRNIQNVYLAKKEDWKLVSPIKGTEKR